MGVDSSRSNTSASLWYLANPASGTHDVVITYPSYVGGHGMALSFKGTNTGAPEAATGTFGYGTTASCAVTPLTNNAWVVDFMGFGYNVSSTSAGPSWTSRISQTQH
jgi:hypothetical protein